MIQDHQYVITKNQLLRLVLVSSSVIYKMDNIGCSTFSMCVHFLHMMRQMSEQEEAKHLDVFVFFLPLLCSQTNELESFVSFPFQKQTDTSVLKSLTVKNVQRILANVIKPAAFGTVAQQPVEQSAIQGSQAEQFDYGGQRNSLNDRQI